MYQHWTCGYILVAFKQKNWVGKLVGKISLAKIIRKKLLVGEVDLCKFLSSKSCKKMSSWILNRDQTNFRFLSSKSWKKFQVLECVQKKMSRMPPEEAARYRLDDCLGGTSATVHQRAIRRIYGDKSADIVEGLKRNPGKNKIFLWFLKVAMKSKLAVLMSLFDPIL